MDGFDREGAISFKSASPYLVDPYCGIVVDSRSAQPDAVGGKCIPESDGREGLRKGPIRRCVKVSAEDRRAVRSFEFWWEGP